MTRPEIVDLLRTDVVAGAKALLGGTLIYGHLRARIVETEAYSWDDPACHAYGRSKMKNMALWSHPGNSYLYFTYGNHWMLNVVAHEHGDAAAVLIRAAEPLEGIEEMRKNRGVEDARNLLSGPGKLAKAFCLDGRFNDQPLFGDSDLHIELATSPVANIEVGVRIGIAVGKGELTPWRFLDGDRLEWVSRPLPPHLRKKH